MVKKSTRGQGFNVQIGTITQAISSPTLLFNGLLLKQGQAVVCDVVHWGLTHYLCKRLAEARSLAANVSSCPIVELVIGIRVLALE
jgi:hypothetical protein